MFFVCGCIVVFLVLFVGFDYVEEWIFVFFGDFVISIDFGIGVNFVVNFVFFRGVDISDNGGDVKGMYGVVYGVGLEVVVYVGGEICGRNWGFEVLVL